MHNCGLGGAIGGTHTVRPGLCKVQFVAAVSRNPTHLVGRVHSATATVATSSSAEHDSAEGSPQAGPQPQTQGEQEPEGDTSSAGSPASRRRRRSKAGPAATKKQQRPAAFPLQSDLPQLFQQPPEAVKRVRRISSKAPAVLPAGAEQDAAKVADANKKAAAEAKRLAQLQLDPQLVADFQPYAESFKQATAGPLQLPRSQAQMQDASVLSAAGPTEVLQQQDEQDDDQEQQQQQQQQQQDGPRARTRASQRDFTELFSVKAASPAAQAPQVVRVDRDTPLAPLPDAAKAATQKLAHLLAEQQLRKQQQQQQQQQQPQQQAPDARLLGPRVQQPGVTRIYLPAPPKAVGTEAERQPLQLLSTTQQLQMREEARRAAVRKLHEKNMRDYEATVQALTNWQSTGTRFYLPGAPTHFPVVVQRQWATLSHSSPTTTTTSSSSSSSSTEADTKGVQQAAAETAAAVRQLSPEEQRALAGISSVVQQQLGSGLPDRALRGERSLLLASLAPQAVRERLARWVAVCGKEYVAQLVMKEPTLLGHEPRVLLDTLEGVSQEMGLSTQDCVALTLKQPAVIGLNGQELRERLQGLAEAVGCDRAGAVRLAAASSTLIMLHPSYIKARMSALAKLLPEAAAKLPRLVVRHPYLLVKSPGAVARSILQMSDTLDLSAWATCRLVAGLPSLLNTNYDTIRNRLDRLNQLTTPVRRWNRELLAMSPSALARCLSCSDSAINRLQQLVDVGAAGSARLPPINKVLTQPAVWWDRSFVAIAAAREKAAEEVAAEAAAAAEIGLPGRLGGDKTEVDAQSAAQIAARTAARAALAKVRSSSAAEVKGVPAVSSTQSMEDEGIMETESQGVLGGDASWRASLTSALLGAATDIRDRWLGQGQGQQQSATAAADSTGPAQQAGAQQEAAAAGAGGRYRRRR